ncbi:MAG TPA: NAD(P)H-dependent glycerol-3-phosphate dehydrogenase [Actinobacteria bacterium]|nr:NAD(P)H-dependent glycerol-3-phosphate dehydrogenase [Actinomycetota bacterium]
MSKVAVIGAGSWGTAVSGLLVHSGQEVTLWGRDSALVETINASGRNPRYLKDIQITKGVRATSDLARALENKEFIAVAVPSHAMRSAAVQIADKCSGNPIIISLTKGIEIGTLERMSQIIEETVKDAKVAVLSGPNHAEEISLGIPSASVVAAQDNDVRARVQELFMAPSFRVYTNKDVIGVEMAAATKNVIAIAVGISDGLGYGDNGRAALMTRGLAEMTRLGTAMGARPMTFAGLAGVGDLIATCTSRHSRNRAVGEDIAKGRTVDESQAELGMIAEGIKTAEAVCELAERFQIEMPINQAVYEVIYQGKDPSKCVSELMNRGPAEEDLG